MAEYKKKAKLRTLTALCFAEADQTYHHWKVFAPGSDGLCIDFDKQKLLASIPGPGRNGFFRHQAMDYFWIKELKDKGKPDVDKLPFLKRKQFKDEKEYRIVYFSRAEENKSIALPIDIKWIRRITLSPWLHPDLTETLKSTLKDIPGCSAIEVVRSKLLENAQWRALASSSSVK
jgi:hypothetical protein